MRTSRFFRLPSVAWTENLVKDNAVVLTSNLSPVLKCSKTRIGVLYGSMAISITQFVFKGPRYDKLFLNADFNVESHYGVLTKQNIGQIPVNVLLGCFHLIVAISMHVCVAFVFNRGGTKIIDFFPTYISKYSYIAKVLVQHTNKPPAI